MHEETSSSEQSGLDGPGFPDCFLGPILPAMAFEAKLHTEFIVYGKKEYAINATQTTSKTQLKSSESITIAETQQKCNHYAPSTSLELESAEQRHLQKL